MKKKFSIIGLSLSLIFQNNSSSEVQKYKNYTDTIRVLEGLPLERENISQITVLYRPKENNTGQVTMSNRPNQERQHISHLGDLSDIQNQEREDLSQQDLERITKSTKIIMETDPNPKTSNVKYNQEHLIEIAEKTTLEEIDEIIKLEEKLYEDLQINHPNLAEERKKHILDFFKFVKEEKESEKAEIQRQKK